MKVGAVKVRSREEHEILDALLDDGHLLLHGEVVGETVASQEYSPWLGESQGLLVENGPGEVYACKTGVTGASASEIGTVKAGAPELGSVEVGISQICIP